MFLILRILIYFNLIFFSMEETDTVEVGKTRKSARLSANHAKFIENMEDSDMRPSVKKSKTMNDSHVIPDFMFQRPIIRTTQCLFCETYPASTCGYAQHLQRRHKTTLKASGIFLLCSCGFEVRSTKYYPNHTKNCSGHEFTVQILDEDTEVVVVSKMVTRSSNANAVARQIPCVPGRSAHYARRRSEPTEKKLGNEEDEEKEEMEDEEEGREKVEDTEGKAEENEDDDEEEAVYSDQEEEENEEDEEEVDVDKEENEDDKEEMENENGEKEENRGDYKKGGYHPVRIGDVFNEKYQVVRKLGWGRFSTVWLCDEAHMNRSVALKIVKANYTATAKDEIELLLTIRSSDTSDPHRNKVVQLLDSFSTSGVNGDHVCMVFEPLEWNLLKLIQAHNTGIETGEVKVIIRQVLEGLDYMHTKCQIIHSDIKPENILVTMIDHETYEVKIADLGSACWTTNHFMDEIQTKEYRAPEVLIGLDYGTAADIWSAACLAFELATGDCLFAPKEGPNYASDADHLEKIAKLLGPIPPDVYNRGAYWNDFFNEDGDLLHLTSLEPFSLIEELLWRDWSDDDADQFAFFLAPMLELDQNKRATAAQCLQEEWLQLHGGPAAAAAEGDETAAAAEQEAIAAAAEEEEVAAEGDEIAAAAAENNFLFQ